MEGYIKLHRKILEWEWYDDPNTMRLFLHILLKANYIKKSWRGIEILPGQLLTGRRALAQETGLGEQQVRTSLSKLKKTGEITIETTNDYSILTLANWDTYNQQDNQRVTNDQPTSNQRVTTTKKDKKEKKDKNKTEVFFRVFLTDDEVESLKKKYGPLYQKGIERLSSYKGSTGKKYVSDYHAMIGWVYDAVLKNSSNPRTATNAITTPKVYTLPTNVGSSSKTTTIVK